MTERIEKDIDDLFESRNKHEVQIALLEKGVKDIGTGQDVIKGLVEGVQTSVTKIQLNGATQKGFFNGAKATSIIVKIVIGFIFTAIGLLIGIFW